MANKKIQFIGDDGYEKRISENKKVKDIIEFCKENDMNLMGFVDKDNDKALEKGMSQIFNSIIDNKEQE
tara:strand:+ start:381 stop:587 length:207 start_codon:yes stop_codon:yes gene_type:complete